METLQNKIDFALVIAVHHANPNGDPPQRQPPAGNLRRLW